MRTILSYIKDGFVVSKRHHPTLGGVPYSQLPVEVQEQLLAYEVSVDLLINLPDPEVLDIFSRLNSYAVVLNEQEKINADHFGPFKVLADRVGHKYFDYWSEQGVLTSKQVMRMLEVNLVADLLIALIEGIKSKKQIKKFYSLYENHFPHDTEELEARFDMVIGAIAETFPEGLSDTEFRRPHLFYSLFTAIAHKTIGIPSLPTETTRSFRNSSARASLERIEEIFSETDQTELSKSERQFLEDSRRATTDEKVRTRRTSFLIGLMS